MIQNNPKNRGVQISPKYFKSDWDILELNGRTKDWQKAIDIFEDRMKGRFFNQIELLDSHDKKETKVYAGFAIMALDCLLIETLEQFINGRIRTGIGMDEDAFYQFFQRSEKLMNFFNTKKKSKIFYTHIRCGLLHQAQTKKKSIIHIRKEPLLQWININNIDEGISIQRREFHSEIANIFNDYCAQLRNDSNMNLRGKFKKKMNHIINQK